MRSGKRITFGLVGLVLLVVLVWLIRDLSGGSTTSGGSVPGSASGLRVAAISTLPAQAKQTYQLIERGGPFPYPHNDGVVFGNREHRLPSERSGYYHEYTVPTPGNHDRGVRRLITGSDHELYYTGDHYDTFVVVDPGR